MSRLGLNPLVDRGRKHILFLTHYFPPEVNVPASRTYEHARRWVKKGVKVTVITNHPNHPRGKLFSGYKNRFISHEIMQGVNVIRVKTFLTPNAGFWRRIVNHLFFTMMALAASLRVKDVDTVIATSPQFFCGLAGSLISEVKGKRFILEVRDLWPDALIALKIIGNPLLIRQLRRLEKWMYFSADTIVTTGSSLRDYIVNIGYPANKVMTIMNGADLEVFDVIKYSGKSGNSEEPLAGKFIVCYVGTFGLAHGLETLLEASHAIRDYPDIHFLLIGDGAERQNLILRAKKLKLTNVTISPLQPKEKIAEHIASSDLGIVVVRNIPLFRTIISAKIFEYLAMKKPVILATGESEGSELIKRHNCGLVIEPENSLQLKDAILKLYKDKNLRKELGENGYRAVQQQYNREVMAERMLRIIVPHRGENAFDAASQLKVVSHGL